MKPQWVNDDWHVVSGTFPQVSRSIRRHTVGNGIVAEMKGFDANGNEAATASATFSVYELPDTVVKADFYHHSNKYSVDTLTLPSGVTIDSDLVLMSPPPTGVVYITQKPCADNKTGF
jgi:hypothetical protein